MKYKNDYINKLEAALNLTQTINDALVNNKPATKEELAQVTKRVEKILEFLLERIELESDNG